MNRTKKAAGMSGHRFAWRTSGQAIIEYTILFAVIAAVTCIGTAVFFQRVCRSQDGSTPILKTYFNRVVEQIR